MPPIYQYAVNNQARILQIQPSSIEQFLKHYKERLSALFSQRNNEDTLASERGLPPYVLQQIMECNPLSAFIPSEYGGRGGNTKEALSMLEVSSYQSLPLSLMMGINGALFLQPVANYATEEARKAVFKDVVQNKKMGGLMITEPDHGSDALRMQTSYSHKADSKSYNVKGTKHWAGLTGWADYWLITAREREASGELGRDVSFFIHRSDRGGIKVEETFKNLGLYMLPYGRNQVDINVPEAYKLEPRSTGIKMMLDVLHRSRLQFPGMSTGFLKRMLDEAVTHCKTRFVGGSSLFTYDQVRSRLASLQSYFTMSSAMCNFTSRNVPLTEDTSKMDLAANAIKSVTTDYMQAASQSLLQLVGAKGYRLDHIAGRSIVDSRPFQIFEGSNDILYQQITESVLKLMKMAKVTNLYEFMKDHPLMQHAAEHFQDLLNFEVDMKMAQRKLVELGKALGRVISLNMTLEMGHRGFNTGMVQNALDVVQQEVSSLIQSFAHPIKPAAVEEIDLSDNGLWRAFV